MTGRLTVSNVAPRYSLDENDQAADARRFEIQVSNGNLRILPTLDNGFDTPVGVPFRLSRDGSISLSNAPSVAVPANTAAGQAAQVTAIDGATGRLAIGGVEMGEHEVDITATLQAGWTAGLVMLRISQGTVFLIASSLSGPTTSGQNPTSALPAPYRPSRPFYFLVPGSTSVSSPNVRASQVNQAGSWFLGTSGTGNISGASFVLSWPRDPSAAWPV